MPKANGKQQEDDPEAVEIMMHFFYNFDYNLSQSETEHHLKHSMVYTIADKYDIPDLKELARVKFGAAPMEDSSDVPGVVFHVFESTPETDFFLRDLCLLYYTIDVLDQIHLTEHFEESGDSEHLVLMIDWYNARYTQLLPLGLSPKQDQVKSDLETVMSGLLRYLELSGDEPRTSKLRELFPWLDKSVQ